ncbi:unnamed protein product, partial [Brassica oleracea var. botrytis]
LVDRESEYEASLVVFTVCLLSGFNNGVGGGMMVVWLFYSGCSSDSLVPRWLLVKQYKEVGVLGLPMKVSLEEGALVSGAGLFSLWSFVLGVLVLAWYRERWVQ